MEIVWSDEAKETFAAVITDIEKSFSKKQSKVFIEETFEVISNLERFPRMYKKFGLKGMENVHLALIHPHTTLFYQIEKSRIGLLFFWFNKDNPDKMKLPT